MMSGRYMWLTFRSVSGAAVIVGIVVFSSPVSAAGLDEARAAIAKQDFAGAAAKFQAAVDQGDPEALAIMGTMYYEGIGVPYDKEKAFQLNVKAAGEGRVDAQFHLAEAYAQRSTKTVDKNARDLEIGEARKWFTAASAGAKPKAEAGDPVGQWILGEFYTVAWGGFPRDFVKSFAWLTKAAEQNVVSAQFKLGMAYELGYGVNPDPVKAREWYMKAAEAGHAGAATRLALMLDKSGEKEEAKILYARAALAGDPIASAMLRDHYNIILGDPREFDKQQTDLLAKEALNQTDSLINFGGVALGIAVITLMGTGDSSGDTAALEKYREENTRNLNDRRDQWLTERMQENAQRQRDQQRDWRLDNQKQMNDVRYGRDVYRYNHQ